MIQTSESITKIAPAIVSAIASMKEAKKSAINPHFNSEYATLPDVLQNLRPTLGANGLALTQVPTFEDGKVSIHSMLIHTSGEFIKYPPTSAPLEKTGVQALCSIITYLRRYNSESLFCVSSEIDDDGNNATDPKSKPVATASVNIPKGSVKIGTNPSPKNPVTIKASKELEDALKDYEATLRDAGFPSDVFSDRLNTIQGRLNAKESEEVITSDIKEKVKKLFQMKGNQITETRLKHIAEKRTEVTDEIPF